MDPRLASSAVSPQHELAVLLVIAALWQLRRCRTRPARTRITNIELGATVVNVLDSSPPFVTREIRYDAVNADPYGRVVAVSVQKKT